MSLNETPAGIMTTTNRVKAVMIFNGRTPVFPPAFNLAVVLSANAIDFTFINMSDKEDVAGTLAGHGRLVGFKVSPRMLPGKFLRYPVAFVLYFLRLHSSLRREKPDVILGCWGGGYLLGRLLLRCGVRSRLVFWANEYIRHDELKFSNPLRYVVWLERALASKADLTVFADPVRGKYQGRYLGTENTMSIRNVPPSGPIDDGPSQLTDLLKDIRRKIPNCKIFAFTGSICNGAKINELLESFSLWPSQCVLVLVGSVDSDLPFFHRDIEQYPDRVFYLPRIPYEEVSRGLKYADAGIAFYNVDQPWVNEKYCAPCKVGDYLKIGLPVLLSNNETLEELIKTYPIGVAIDPRFPDAIALGVCSLIESINNRDVESSRIIEIFESKLCMDKQCEPLISLFYNWKCEENKRQ